MNEDKPSQPPSSTAPPRRVMPGAASLVVKLAQTNADTMFAQLEKLKAERAEGRVILELDSKRIRFSVLANRDDSALTPKNAKFLELLESIRQDGQDDPICVKPVTDDPRYDHEVVRGHRRLRVCQELDRVTEGGFPVLAVLEGVSLDRVQHALKMFRENRIRLDPSALEYGRSLKLWLDEGVFKTQRELATSTRLHETTLGQYLQLAELPEVMVKAFADPHDISLRWSKELAKAARDENVLRRAREIANMKSPPDAEAVFRALTRGPGADRPKRGGSTKSESIKVDNKILFTLSRKDDRFSIRLGKHVDREQARDLHEELKQFVLSRLTGRSKGRP